MKTLYVIKIGGNIIDDEERLHAFVRSLAAVDEQVLLVHGGGKLATKMAGALQVPQQLVDGRRITDSETLKIVTMVYAGLVNKTIVALLHAAGRNAIGLTGADADIIRAHKRQSNTDYGFVGDIDRINTVFLTSILNEGLCPVLAPITHDGHGQLLNTNADTIARETAIALSVNFNVRLIYGFEKNGVLQHANDDASIIPRITPPLFEQLKQQGVVSGGMLPKLENALAALKAGVQEIAIGRAENLQDLLQGNGGTRIVHE